MPQPRLIAISGPTGVGKTAYAIQLALEIDAEIISFDSRQIYRELNIGVARPSEEELSAVKHHLIAHKSIHDRYSAQDFVQDVNSIIQNSKIKTQNYILVGGTGFYLRAFEFGLDEIPNISEYIRAEIHQEFLENGIEFLQNEVQRIDPKSYESMEKDNPRRLLRIVEIWREHQLIYSEVVSRNDSAKMKIEHIIVDLHRDILYDRINRRVDLMIAQGLEDEVRSLEEFKLNHALNTVGYSEFFDYFDGNISKSEAIDKIKQHSRNYAKRQITWNKKYIDKDAKIIHKTN